MSSYREKPEADPREDELVTVATYVDVVEAEMARADLSVIGVHAFVFEPTGFGHTAGGTRLMVRDADVGTAQAHLADQRRASATRGLQEEAEEADPDAVRCPRCELAYASYGRPKLWTPRNSSSLLFLVFFPAIAILFPFARLFQAKRYRCEKCFFVWDDPKQGAKKRTPLAAGDPRPVFRLRRGSPGMGLFLGAGAGWLVVMVAMVNPGVVLLASLVGWTIGRSITKDVCSEPSCRAPLPPDVTDCPACHGTIAGVIGSAHEHYSEAADVRRELAAAHAKRARKKSRKAS